MKREDIQAMLTGLGARRIRVKRDEVWTNCPFGPWLHKRGWDARPSFSIKVDPKAASRWFCFACGTGGYSLLSFVRKLEQLHGIPIVVLWKWVKAHEGEKVPLAAFVPPKTLDELKFEEDVLDEKILAPYLGRTPKKLLAEGLDLQMCADWEVGTDCTLNRAVFPVRRFDGVLVGVMAKTLYSKKYLEEIERMGEIIPPKWIGYARWEKGRFLYGEHRASAGQSAILVESPPDVLKLRQMGYPNVFGILGAKLTDDQFWKLILFGFTTWYVLLDNDAAGELGADRIRQKARGRARVLACTWPQAESVYDKKTNPRELTAEEVREGLASAKILC